MKTVILVWAFSLSALAYSQTLHFQSDIDQAEILTQYSRNSEMSPIQIQMLLPRVDLVEDSNGDKAVIVPGLAPTQEFGKPELPQNGILIAVPAGYAPRISSVQAREEELQGVRVRPSRKKLRCGGDNEPFVFNSDVYFSEAVTPATWVELSHVGKMGGVSIYRVGLSAARYEPKQLRLKVASELEVELSFEKTGRSSISELSPSMLVLLQASVSNGDQIGRFVRKSRGPELFLVIVADKFKTAIQPWIDWKNEKGYQTKVVTTSEAGGTKEKIKTWIQNFYDQSSVKPSYMLSVGNETSLPAFTETTENGNAVSDYRYALLAGGDEIPDILYGRLVADNETQLQVQIRRWMNYEKNPMLDYAFTLGTTIASKDTQAGHPYDNEYAAMIHKALMAHTYEAFDDYWQKTGNATPSNINTSLNRGRSWLTYIGHGSGTSWGSTNGEYSNSHIQQLSAAPVLPIIIDVACLNGSWATPSTCFGEAWVQHTQGGNDAGAVVYYGASQSTNWHEPAVMAVGAAESHVSKKLESMGSTTLAGLMHLVAKMGTKENVISNFKWYNLFGDPSLSIRTTPAKSYRVNIASGSVTVTDDNGAGLENLLVAVTDASKQLISVQKTDSSGKAPVSTRAGTKVTVTGYNYMSQQFDL